MKDSGCFILSLALTLSLVCIPQAATGGSCCGSASTPPGTGSVGHHHSGSGGGSRGWSPGTAAGIATGAAVLGLVIGATANSINQQNQKPPAGTWGGHTHQSLSPPSNMYAHSGIDTGDSGIGSDATVGGGNAADAAFNQLIDTIDKMDNHNALTFQAIKDERNEGRMGLDPSTAPPVSVNERVAWNFQAVNKHLRDAKKYGTTIMTMRKLYEAEAKKGSKANKNTLIALGEAMNVTSKKLSNSLNQAQAANNSAWHLRSNQNSDGWINGKHHPEDMQMIQNVDSTIQGLRNPFK